MKKFYCLSGIPRAGNTILSCILNQNPNIGVSANSLVSETLFKLEKWKETDIAFRNFPDERSYRTMTKSIIPSYYSEWEQDYIIDRSTWGTPDNYKLLQSYSPNEIKIVCLVRDVAEVVSSFVDWSNRNPDNYINKETNNGSILEKCEYLLHPYGQLIKGVLSAKHLKEIDPERNYHILVDYQDLIENPKLQIERIYNFLDIPNFKHNLKDIKQFKVNGLRYDDSSVGNNLHKVRTNKIEKRVYKTEIPQYILDKCKELNVWK